MVLITPNCEVLELNAKNFVALWTEDEFHAYTVNDKGRKIYLGSFDTESEREEYLNKVKATLKKNKVEGWVDDGEDF